jgi:hypothetical protein
VESTGFGLPESLSADFPGAGGSGSQAGAKSQLVWDYQSQTFELFALIPWNVPDHKYVDTVMALAQPHALFLVDLGDFQLCAFAKIAAAQAYCLSRFNHQTTLREVVGGRTQPLDFPRSLGHDSRPLLEKAVLRGTRDQVAARLIAVRMPEAIGNERRRQARAVAKKRGDTPSQAHLALLAWNLFVTNVPGTVWPPQTVGIAYSFRWQVELGCKAWKSGLHLATLTSITKHSTLCSLYGRMVLIVRTCALCPSLRAAAWQKQQREVSLLRLVRHFHASADQWLPTLFQSGAHLTRCLARACAAAERLVTKEVRQRPTSAQSLRQSLGAQVDFSSPHWHLQPNSMDMSCPGIAGLCAAITKRPRNEHCHHHRLAAARRHFAGVAWDGFQARVVRNIRQLGMLRQLRHPFLGTRVLPFGKQPVILQRQLWRPAWFLLQRQNLAQVDNRLHRLDLTEEQLPRPVFTPPMSQQLFRGLACVLPAGFPPAPYIIAQAFTSGRSSRSSSASSDICALPVRSVLNQ